MKQIVQKIYCYEKNFKLLFKYQNSVQMMDPDKVNIFDGQDIDYDDICQKEGKGLKP